MGFLLWASFYGQEIAYQQSLTVMASAYASPLGTTVARFSRVPHCPVELAAVVGVAGAVAGAGEAVREALGRSGRGVVSLTYSDDDGVWRGELGSAEEAAEAVAELKEMPISLSEIAEPDGASCDLPYMTAMSRDLPDSSCATSRIAAAPPSLHGRCPSGVWL